MKHYTITTEDIGAAHIRVFGKLWPVSEFIGRIMKRDVGKRVYPRGGILQVENDEQRAARMACCPPEAKSPLDAFEINVAWLRFMAKWKPGVNGPTLVNPTEQAILRLIRAAFDWAMEYPQEQSAPPIPSGQSVQCRALHNHNPDDYDATMAAPRCGCPTGCGWVAVMHLFRVTGMVHETPIYEDVATVFCAPCGEDALESGLYCVGDDLLEPNHGPGCVKRMRDDTEEGQS